MTMDEGLHSVWAKSGVAGPKYLIVHNFSDIIQEKWNQLRYDHIC